MHVECHAEVKHFCKHTDKLTCTQLWLTTYIYTLTTYIHSNSKYVHVNIIIHTSVYDAFLLCVDVLVLTTPCNCRQDSVNNTSYKI